MFWSLLFFSGVYGVSADPLPVSHWYYAPPDVILDSRAPVRLREVKRAVRWWGERCLPVNDVWRAPCGPGHSVYFNSICITGMPEALEGLPPDVTPVAATEILPFIGPLASPDRAHGAIIYVSDLKDEFTITHELGHALAFSNDDAHHTAGGTVMAAHNEAVGWGDQGVNLCVR